MSELENVLRAAMHLPAQARAHLVAELIQSLEDSEQPEPDLESAWADEIQARLANADAEPLAAIPWEEAQKRLIDIARGRVKTP